MSILYGRKPSSGRVDVLFMESGRKIKKGRNAELHKDQWLWQIDAARLAKYNDYQNRTDSDRLLIFDAISYLFGTPKSGKK